MRDDSFIATGDDGEFQVPGTSNTQQFVRMNDLTDEQFDGFLNTVLREPAATNSLSTDIMSALLATDGKNKLGSIHLKPNFRGQTHDVTKSDSLSYCIT